MMKKLLYMMMLALSIAPLSAQIDKLYGDFDEYRLGIHSGNQIRCTIWNDGEIGGKNLRSELIALEWPINSGYAYFGQTMIKIGAEVKDSNGDIVHIFSESMGWKPEDPTDPGSGDMGPDGEWWTILPLPGFANPNEERLAMSHWGWSWPTYWPDKMDDAVDPGWPTSWNGYFGKDIKNADQESFFVADDYNNKEFAFYPDRRDSTRRGLGMRVTARGFQWSNALVEDLLFCLYDVKNIGTTRYKKIVFAQFAGPAIGNTVVQGGDNGDDNGGYELEQSLVYSYDEDNLGNTGWSPVGYYGCAFLESPGNPIDGIDNDYDGQSGSGGVIDESMFVEKTLQQGETVVLIDYKNYERSKVAMPNDTLRIPYNDKIAKFWPGKAVEEIEHNQFDDNLNGLVDENNGATFGAVGNQVTTYLYVGSKYVDYFSGEGEDNPLIDEYRDDGVDNDGDWDPLLDDVGLDGVPFTGDYGESDAQPTSGWQPIGAISGLIGDPNKFGLVDTNLPGEPHLDKTDISESDMIGLTSFYLYTPWSLLPGYDDALIWEKTKPGYLDDRSQNSDTDFTFGSGYFPMDIVQIERFSIAHMMGINLEDLLINKSWGDRAYNENYNFSKAPNIPHLTVIPGDNQVTLFWDEFAEQSIDPILGQDFEGYRIYRSTDPGWQDMAEITDGYGSTTYRKPMAQFDLNNEYSGYSLIDIKGVLFWLGENTGIVHSYVDSTARNGYTYYYAVTAYDRGDPAKGIAPSECTKYIAIDQSGNVDKGTNVAICRPESPVAGYLPPLLENMVLVEGSSATGRVAYEIIDRTQIKNQHQYQIVFKDTLVETDNMAFAPATLSYSLIDVTNLTQPDTLIRDSRLVKTGDVQPVIDGFKLSLFNVPLVELWPDSCQWSRPDIYSFTFNVFKYSKTNGIAEPADYRIDFFDQVGADTSTEVSISATRKLSAMPVNFTITDMQTQKKVPFAFWEKDVLAGEEGKLTAFTDKSRTDQLILLDQAEHTPESPAFTWSFEFDTATNDSLHDNPGAGDYVIIRTLKPFLSHDHYEFTSIAESINQTNAKEELDKIRVVPNPYVVANS
ncbi:MAG: hypothetical protein EHM72_13160, partial [Calditrichaeota bacterium]